MQSARGFEYGVKHIICPPEISGGASSYLISDALLSILGFDFKQTDDLLNLGAVYKEGQRITENQMITSGTYLRIHSKPRRFPKDDGRWTERIHFQNEHFVLVQKTSGLPVHASVDNLRENVQAYVSAALQGPLFVTHRLDVPTRGLIVFAKTKEFQSAFNKALIQREVKKIYHALVEIAEDSESLPTKGFLKHYMENSPRAPKHVDKIPHEGWQECLLEILEIEEKESFNPEAKTKIMKLKILLHTGRTHQIRAQLGFEKWPIIGDLAYGASRNIDEESIELEANELEFTNPLTNEHHHFKLTGL